MTTRERITRKVFLKKLFKDNPLAWMWLSASEKELFENDEKAFVREYFKTWELKEEFEKYLHQQKEEKDERNE